MANPTDTLDLLRNLAGTMGLPAFAYSLDGARFLYDAPLVDAVRVGSIVEIDTGSEILLGEVESSDCELRESVSISVDKGDVVGLENASAELTPRTRRATGAGKIIAAITADDELVDSSGAAFAESRFSLARTEAVLALLARRRSGAYLEFGRLRSADSSARVGLRASGFARHTFVCGQSGSGKTFALGVLLEQLLLRTDLRVVVIDPNSDQIRVSTLLSREALDATRSDAVSDETWSALSQRHTELVSNDRVVVARNSDVQTDGPNAHPIAIRLTEMGTDVIASVLGIDPIDDDVAFEALSASLAQVLDGLSVPEMFTALARGNEYERQVARRLKTMGLADWKLWAWGAPTSTLERLDDPDTRMLVYDVGSLTNELERDVAVLTLLRKLWDERTRRIPTLVVVDEAHNVCPRSTSNTVVARSRELMAAIAGEGRKYGLHMLVATQRPARLDPAVTSQCDNLVLMRMNSSSDTEDLATIFSHLPSGMIHAARSFAMGNALVGGPICDPPLIACVEGRMTPEGGGDVATSWADLVLG